MDQGTQHLRRCACMTTSVSRSSTSTRQSRRSTSTKLSVLPRLSHASPNTGTKSPRLNVSGDSSKTSNTSKRTINRVRYLITQEETGLFLGTMTDGRPVWVKDPLLAMQHCHEETVLRNLYALREFYEVPEMLGTKEVTYYAYASNPLEWFTNDA